MKKQLFGFGLIVALCAFQTLQDKRVTISLSTQEWEVVLKGLAELPLKESQSVYGSIMQQAQAQLAPQPKTQQPTQKVDSTKKKQ